MMKNLIKKVDYLLAVEIGLILLAGIWCFLGIYEFIPKPTMEWSIEILLGTWLIDMIRKGVV